MASANADAGTVVVDVLVVVVVGGGESSRAATKSAAPTSPATAARAATEAAALAVTACVDLVHGTSLSCRAPSWRLRTRQLGRAVCLSRGCQYVQISWVPVIKT